MPTSIDEFTLKGALCRCYGQTGQDFKETKQQNVRFSSYFRSEFHFREETITVSGETPFLYLLAFPSRLSETLVNLVPRVFSPSLVKRPWERGWLKPGEKTLGTRLSISLLIRVTEMLFLWLERVRLTVKKIRPPTIFTPSTQKRWKTLKRSYSAYCMCFVTKFEIRMEIYRKFYSFASL